MRLSPARTKYAFGIAIAALLAGCSGGAQFSPQNLAGASLHSRHVRPLSAADSVLYAFTAGKSDGSNPNGSPVIDSKGALYGTSMNTPGGVGLVWKLTPSGSTYKESVLYTFPKDKSQGAYPQAGLAMDSSGALYGTASAGGKGKCTNGCGTIFKLAPSKNGYTESVLYDFGLKSTDGTLPDAALLLVGSELYGTTEYGGTGKCSLFGVNGCGTVFELSTKGSGYKILYSFKGGSKDGNYLQTSVVADKNGVLYGTTNNGGKTGSGGVTSCPAGCGIVFSVTPKGAEKVLHFFAGGKDGGIPSRGRGVYVGPTGIIVGTTQVAGSGGCGLGFLQGCGVVFELKPSGKTYKESIVYTFQPSNDMQAPNEELIADKSGNLYGTAFLGGGGSCMLGCGGIFKLTASKGTYTEGVAYQFQGGKDGALPYAGVSIDSSGNLFGTTYEGDGASGCSLGCGTVYELTP
ncbi:MAG TPA: choice-of-anchor tandem repeat GloVer-containing protein [Candidatus Cybelea sp.]|jgi:uncharacterized repeat protein (TIGR03803 family)